MQREIMTSIPFLSQPSAAAENTEEDLAVAQHVGRASQWLRGHGGQYDRRSQAHHRFCG